MDLSYDPTPAEIEEWLTKYAQKSEIIERGSVQDCFNSGTEVCSPSPCRLVVIRLSADSVPRSFLLK